MSRKSLRRREDPPEFVCPISRALMEDPVTLEATGQVYDRKHIEQWFERGNQTCPATGISVQNFELRADWRLKDAIERWKKDSATGGGRDEIDDDDIVGNAGCLSGFFALFGGPKRIPKPVPKPSYSRPAAGRSAPLDSTSTAETKTATPISVATEISNCVRQDKIGDLRNFIRDGYDLNAFDDRGRAGLHWAALSGNERVMFELINNGAHINLPDKMTYTPLHHAAQSGQEGAVRWLVDKGGNVNAKTANGFTPLHKAAYWGRFEVVHVLLKNGGDPRARNGDGESATAVAFNSPHKGAKDIARMLGKYNKQFSYS